MPRPLALALHAAFSLAALSLLAVTLPAVAQSDTPEPSPDATLPVVRVSGARETATGPVTGVAAKRSATGTKADAALVETPQSISVIGAAELEQRAVSNVKEAVGYSAGVTPTVSMDAREDLISLRGFPFDWASSYLDGLQLPSSTYANAMVEPYGLERIEVLKGPASMLYGASSTGGLINMVSKRPTVTPLRELQVQFGNHGRRQVAADFSGALGAEWSYRLTGLARESRSEVEFVRDDRRYIAPALTWRPSAQTQLTLLASWQKDDLGDSGGTQAFLPASGIALPNPNGRISRRTNGGEPDFDFYRKEQRSLGYELEHRFSDTLSLEQALRVRDVDLDYQTAYGSGLDPDDPAQRRVLRSAFGSFGGNESLTVDTRLVGRFVTAAVQHQALVGVDFRRTKVEERNYFGPGPALENVFAPVYGAPIALPDAPMTDQRVKSRQLGVYVQDQLRIDRWVATLGLRWDTSRNDIDEFSTPYAFVKKETKLTGRAGLNYLMDNGLAPYASVATSFTPTLDPNAFGEPFDARTGKQYELGVKYQPPGSDALVTAAVFEIRQRNTLTADPDQENHPFGQVQSGEYRSRGFELEAKSQFDLAGRNALSVIAAYTFLEAEFTRAAPGAENLPVSNLGNAPKGVPRHSASLWLDWRLPAAWSLGGWSVALGARHVGERPNTDTTDTRAPGSRFMLPAFTVMDAALRYEGEAYQAALNVGNLTDKTTVDCWGDRCWYGAGRSVRVTLGYKW